jgi:hypothetical protein
MMRFRHIKRIAYGSMVLLHVTCIVVSYTLAHELYGNGKVLHDKHEAWMFEAYGLCPRVHIVTGACLR